MQSFAVTWSQLGLTSRQVRLSSLYCGDAAYFDDDFADVEIEDDISGDRCWLVLFGYGRVDFQSRVEAVRSWKLVECDPDLLDVQREQIDC